MRTGHHFRHRPGSKIAPLRWVLVRDPSSQRPVQAFFSTDPALSPQYILAFFVRRWQVEVTFAEVRAHLGVETLRQWSDLAILRTTPALLGLYSLMTMRAANSLRKRRPDRNLLDVRSIEFAQADANRI